MKRDAQEVPPMISLPNPTDLAAAILAAPDRLAAADLYLAARTLFRSAGEGVPLVVCEAMRARY